ncbi:hypothetical protein RB213_008807 [Colletotrichum asianum]
MLANQECTSAWLRLSLRLLVHSARLKHAPGNLHFSCTRSPWQLAFPRNPGLSLPPFGYLRVSLPRGEISNRTGRVSSYQSCSIWHMTAVPAI